MTKLTPAFGRMKETAKRDKAKRFTNLLHLIKVDLLRAAYHKLNARKASGIDGMTKQKYGKDVENRLQDLENRIHTGDYQPSPSRQILIPKENGKTRPIAVSNLEDKIVQLSVAMILEALYEPLFSNRSVGYRPKRGAHQAIGTAYHLLKRNGRPYVVECDLSKFFDSMDHARTMEILQNRIVDPRFLKLIEKLMKTGIRQADTGKIIKNQQGTPQGSVVSPILANIYLHEVLDKWFSKHFANHNQAMIRYADDIMFCFNKRQKALSFLRSLKSRLNENKLSVNEEKTRMVDFRVNNRQVFNLLGFTFYWGKTPKGKPLLKLKTKAEKLRQSLYNFKMWIKENRNRFKLKDLWEQAAAQLRGHYAYYGVTFNRGPGFYYITCTKLLFKWLNRRSQKHSFSRQKFQKRLLHHPLPKPWGYQAFNISQGVFDYAV
jgi:group II intron reverse transcriptase/maturase